MRRATDNLAKDENADIISIHALHEESDYPIFDENYRAKLFQSTLSMRRATYLTANMAKDLIHFNPRSP